MSRPAAPATTVGEAEAEVALAKVRLRLTLSELKRRFAPATLRDEAIDRVRTKSASLAQSAIETVRERPVPVTGAVAGLALFVLRKPLFRLARRLFSQP